MSCISFMQKIRCQRPGPSLLSYTYNTKYTCTRYKYTWYGMIYGFSDPCPRRHRDRKLNTNTGSPARTTVLATINDKHSVTVLYASAHPAKATAPSVGFSGTLRVEVDTSFLPGKTISQHPHHDYFQPITHTYSGTS